jgi:hypothetical protein
MKVRLPLVNKAGGRMMVESSRHPCSEKCVYRNPSRFKAFIDAGLGATRSDDTILLILTRDKTILKHRRFTTPYHWRELGYDFVIDPTGQNGFLRRFQEDPPVGLAAVKAFCDCSTESVFIEGELATGSASPVTRYYQNSFAVKANWTRSELTAFAQDAIETISGLHERGIVHGDLVGHNFIVDREGRTWLTDLDTLGSATEETMMQDYLVFVAYTILPIASTFMPHEDFQRFFATLLQGLFDGLVDARTLPILLNRALSGSPDGVSVFFASLVSRLNEQLSKYSFEYERTAQALGQSHILLAETHRILTEKFREHEQAAKEYTASLRAALAQKDEYIASLQVALAEREKALEEERNRGLAILRKKVSAALRKMGVKAE